MYKSHDEDTFIETSECIVMPTIFQATTTQPKEDFFKVSLSFFIVFNRLTVV